MKDNASCVGAMDAGIATLALTSSVGDPELATILRTFAQAAGISWNSLEGALAAPADERRDLFKAAFKASGHVHTAVLFAFFEIGRLCIALSTNPISDRQAAEALIAHKLRLVIGGQASRQIAMMSCAMDPKRSRGQRDEVLRALLADLKTKAKAVDRYLATPRSS
jgi:hypothetical protein